MHFSIIRIMDD
jgi:hypothetical protein